MILVTDMDEVLTDISPPWYELMYARKDYFGQYYDLERKRTAEEVMQRDHYYLNEWLKKEGVEVPPEVFKDFMKLYQNNYFYDLCTLTPMGRAVQLLQYQDFCTKIVIVSHTLPGTEEGKEKWVKRHFNHPKVELRMIPINEPKSKVISEYDFDTYIDDNLTVLKEVIANTDSFGKTFMAPKLGYNKLDEEIQQIVYQKGAIMQYYSVDNPNMRPFP